VTHPLTILLLCAFFVGCGGGGEPERPDPFAAIEQDHAPARPEDRAAPRWDVIHTLRGDSTIEATVEVREDAIQWRVRWWCDEGEFTLAVLPEPVGSDGVREPCQGRSTSKFIGHGRYELAVEASGPWKAVVEQQVDTPLREPPLEDMREDRVVATGRFEDVERPGGGSAKVYRLPSGRLALRLEDFVTEPNIDLFVWLSRAERPRTTRQALASEHQVAARLKSTLGDQNYLLPRDTRPSDLHSIVIWCEPVRIAYTAAPLRWRRRGRL
jgi:hypothetical protein